MEKLTEKDLPIGTKVKYHPIAGMPYFKETEVRSVCWKLGHGELVVKVKGIAGAVCVSHLELKGE